MHGTEEKCLPQSKMRSKQEITTKNKHVQKKTTIYATEKECLRVKEDPRQKKAGTPEYQLMKSNFFVRLFHL